MKLKRFAWIIAGLLGLSALPLNAGQLLWTAGGDRPALVLSLGDGTVRKSLDLPSGATSLTLTLRKFLLEDERLRLVWKSDGELWLREAKKIPGDETTEGVALPPGHQITLEISTWAGTPVASIKLRRN
jgi:hypothetical protein